MWSNRRNKKFRDYSDEFMTQLNSKIHTLFHFILNVLTNFCATLKAEFYTVSKVIKTDVDALELIETKL